MRKQYREFITFGIVLLLLSIFTGCPDSSTPKITLTVTDCNKNDITVTENTNITTQSGNQWSLSTTITVKCSGQPVPNAEIKLEFWWPGGTFKRTTNESGEVRYTKRGHGDKPSNKTFTVTIKGNDGDKDVDFTIP
ncbi:MAG: hypothetical protein P8100_08910 [bacterium]|jgi:hypothetical protein